jgi:hypothetical protein
MLPLLFFYARQVRNYLPRIVFVLQEAESVVP